jgi:hypothetical protein
MRVARSGGEVVHGLLHTCAAMGHERLTSQLHVQIGCRSAGRWRRMTHCHAVTLQARLACSSVGVLLCRQPQSCFVL